MNRMTTGRRKHACVKVGDALCTVQISVLQVQLLPRLLSSTDILSLAVQAKINGRPGLVVSGGSGRGNRNMTSVEFFDARTGEWLSLPSLNRGRRSHVMTVTKVRGHKSLKILNIFIIFYQIFYTIRLDIFMPLL